MLRNGISFLIITANFLVADYYISFDFISKNGILTSYHFNCSKTSTENSKKKFLFSIPAKYNKIFLICKYQQNLIVKQLMKYSFHIYSFETKGNNRVFYKIKGVFLPKRFDIIIRDKKVYFYLKEPN